MTLLLLVFRGKKKTIDLIRWLLAHLCGGLVKHTGFGPRGGAPRFCRNKALAFSGPDGVFAGIQPGQLFINGALPPLRGPAGRGPFRVVGLAREDFQNQKKIFWARVPRLSGRGYKQLPTLGSVFGSLFFFKAWLKITSRGPRPPNVQGVHHVRRTDIKNPGACRRNTN